MSAAIQYDPTSANAFLRSSTDNTFDTETLPVVAPQKKRTYLNRTVGVIKKTVKGTVLTIKFLAVKTLQIISELKNDCNSLATLFRGAGYAIMGLKACGKSVLPHFDRRTSDAVGLIDSIQVLGDLDYFLRGKWKDDSVPQLIGRIALAIADVGGLLLWLQELGFGLSRIAHAIGKVRFFRFVPLIPLGNIVCGVVGVGFFFLGVDAAWRLFKTRNVTENEDPNVGVKRTKAILDMIWCGFEVVGKVLLIAAALSIIPVAAPGVIAAFGLTAAAFGLTSFAYGVYNKKRLGDAAIIGDMQR